MTSKRYLRLILNCIPVIIIAFVLTVPVSVSGQPSSEWFGDEHVVFHITMDGTSITNAPESDPIVIDLDVPVNLTIRVNTTGSLWIYNLTGSIGFFYQGIRVFTIGVQQAVVQFIPPNVTLPKTSTLIDFGSIFRQNVSGYSLDLLTGIYQVSVDFRYYLESDLTTPRHIGRMFYVSIPPKDIVDLLTSVTGATAAVITGGAIVGTATNIRVLLDALQTAHKVRSIQKKAGEIKSLPNLTVIGALPALFSAVGFIRVSEKKKDASLDSESEESKRAGEYILRQRLREVAPVAWLGDKCPGCRKPWNKTTKFCKKCNADEDDAKRMYGDLLVSKAPRAMKVLGKKKALSIRKLAKKTKSSQYTAGVIGAAMVDTGLTEITKIETPIRSLATNIAGLAFIVVTWQQLLGGWASQFQTTLTIVGAGLSLGVIIALYFARKTQIKKFTTEVAKGQKMLPTEAEDATAQPAGGPVSTTQPAGGPVSTTQPAGGPVSTTQSVAKSSKKKGKASKGTSDASTSSTTDETDAE